MALIASSVGGPPAVAPTRNYITFHVMSQLSKGFLLIVQNIHCCRVIFSVTCILTIIIGEPCGRHVYYCGHRHGGHNYVYVLALLPRHTS